MCRICYTVIIKHATASKHALLVNRKVNNYFVLKNFFLCNDQRSSIFKYQIWQARRAGWKGKRLFILVWSCLCVHAPNYLAHCWQVIKCVASGRSKRLQANRLIDIVILKAILLPIQPYQESKQYEKYKRQKQAEKKGQADRKKCT